MRIDARLDLPPGDYLLKIADKGGNSIHSLLRVQRLAVVKESYLPKDGGELYVVDARSGAPVKDAKVEAFCYHAVSGKDRKFEYKEIGPITTDENGCAKIPKIDGITEYGYIAVTSPDGALEVVRTAWNPVCRESDSRDLKD